MHAVAERNVYAGFVDMWVEIAPTIEKNIPQPFSGVVTAQWWSMGNDYMQLEDGRVYSRPDSYDVHSPYGWKKVHGL